MDINTNMAKLNHDKEILIFENLHLENEIAELYSLVTSNLFPWYMTKRTLSEEQANKQEVKFDPKDFPEYDIMQHLFIGFAENNSSAEHLAIKLLEIFSEKSGYKFNKIIRAQANYIHKKDVGLPSPPHVDDMENKHYVLLCYLNDSDGDTVMYDNDMTEVCRVSPKRGKFILFDGSIYHSASPPTKTNNRIVFNYNLGL